MSPSRHQPDWLTQMSPSLQESAAAAVVDTVMIAKISIVVVTISRIFIRIPPFVVIVTAPGRRRFPKLHRDGQCMLDLCFGPDKGFSRVLGLDADSGATADHLW